MAQSLRGGAFDPTAANGALESVGGGSYPCFIAELDVRAFKKSKATYQAVVTNRGPDTVILNKIDHAGDDDFFVGPPLHRDDLELIPGARHEFMVAPTMGMAQPLEASITFTDESGPRTKTYPIYI